MDKVTQTEAENAFILFLLAKCGVSKITLSDTDIRALDSKAWLLVERDRAASTWTIEVKKLK